MNTFEFRVRTFGKLSALTASSEVLVRDVPDTDSLHSNLLQRFPEFARVPFRIVVNRKFISGNQVLKPGDEIAVMPPFSGG